MSRSAISCGRRASRTPPRRPEGVKPPVGARFAFEEAREAFEALRSGAVFGKIVVGVA